MSYVEEYIEVVEAAQLTRLDGCEIMWMFNNGKFPGARQHRGKLLLPLIDVAPYFLVPPTQRDIPTLAGFSDHKRSAAIEKLKTLHAYGVLVDKYRSVIQSMRETRVRASQALNVPLRTMERWQSRYKRSGLRGLIDTRGGDMRRNKAVRRQ